MPNLRNFDDCDYGLDRCSRVHYKSASGLVRPPSTKLYALTTSSYFSGKERMHRNEDGVIRRLQ